MIIKQFKIFLGKDFFKIIVFDTRKAMYAHRKKIHLEGYSHVTECGFDAICSTRNMLAGEFGEFGSILFWENSAKNIGSVSHEIQHACLYWWLGRVNTSFISKIDIKTGGVLEINSIADEDYATIVGRFNSSYWHEWLKFDSELLTQKGM